MLKASVPALRAEPGIDAGEAFEHLLPGLALRGAGLRWLHLQQRAGTLEVLFSVPIAQQPKDDFAPSRGPP